VNYRRATNTVRGDDEQATTGRAGDSRLDDTGRGRGDHRSHLIFHETLYPVDPDTLDTTEAQTHEPIGTSHVSCMFEQVTPTSAELQCEGVIDITGQGRMYIKAPVITDFTEDLEPVAPGTPLEVEPIIGAVLGGDQAFARANGDFTVRDVMRADTPETHETDSLYEVRL
jgi:hypothetical protein